MNSNVKLSWAGFSTKSPQTLRDILQEKEYTDVTLATEDGTQILAHQVILSSGSVFFKRILSMSNIHQQRPEEGKRHNLRQLLHHQRRCQGHAAGAPTRKERNSETKHEQGTGDKTQVQDAGGRRQHITRRHPQSRVKGACCQIAVPAATA